MLSDTTPRVSVIIPSYNAAAYIRRALESACAQTIRDIEVVVIDDASSDATAKVVLELARTDPRIKYLKRDSNGGPSVARNMGIQVARGEWIAVLDADDDMVADRLERLLELCNTTSADIVADNILITQADGNKRAQPGLPVGPSPYYFLIEASDYVRRNTMLNPGFKLGYLKPMFKREMLLTNGISYDTTVLVGEDYLLCLRALIAGARFIVTSEPRYRYWVNDGSLSSKLHKHHIESLQRAQRLIATQSADEKLRSEIARYNQHLDQLMTFMNFIDAVKQKQVGKAAILGLSEPRIWPQFIRSSSEAVAKRVRRRFAA